MTINQHQRPLQTTGEIGVSMQSTIEAGIFNNEP